MDQITVWVKTIAAFWMLMMLLVALLSQGAGGNSRYERNSRYFIMISMCCVMPAMQFITSNDLAKAGRYSLGFPLLNITGIILVLAGVGFHVVSIGTLKKQWSPNVRFNEDPVLIENGIYQSLRHPIYATVLLELLGFCIALSNWLSFLLIFLPNLLTFLYRIHVEEQALVNVFGEQYLSYMRRTKRFIPGIF